MGSSKTYLRCAWRNDVITTPALLGQWKRCSFCIDGRCDEMVLSETPPTEPRGVYIVDISSSLSENRLRQGKRKEWDGKLSVECIELKAYTVRRKKLCGCLRFRFHGNSLWIRHIVRRVVVGKSSFIATSCKSNQPAASCRQRRLTDRAFHANMNQFIYILMERFKTKRKQRFIMTVNIETDNT